MVQVEQHTDAALAIVGEEHRALEHFDWREAVGAKRYGPSCHSRLEVHLLHHSVLLEKRVHDLSMESVERRLRAIIPADPGVPLVTKVASP